MAVEIEAEKLLNNNNIYGYVNSSGSSNRTGQSMWNWCFLDAKKTPIQDTRESEVFHSTLSSVQDTSNSVNSSSLIQTTLERASNMVRASMSGGLYLRLNRSQRKKASSALTNPGERPFNEKAKKIIFQKQSIRIYSLEMRW